jgi:inorganic pyrophosphatase
MRCVLPWAIKTPFCPWCALLPQSSRLFMTAATTSFSTRVVGKKDTLGYKVYFTSPNDSNKLISPFHDIPLKSSVTGADFNMVVEIPRFSNAKLEISKELPLNPIKQDIKKGTLRYVKNLFPHKGYMWNYGAIPQTWEWPEHVDPHTAAKGDNDPIDVIEIGSKVRKTGDIVPVKVLGVMALLDEGETDWKILSIAADDPLASQLNTTKDVDKFLPGLLDATRRWLRCYKLADGKTENRFAFGGEWRDRSFALDVINESHGFWQKLKSGVVDSQGINVNFSGHLDLSGDKEEIAAPLDESIDQFYYFPN